MLHISYLYRIHTVTFLPFRAYNTYNQLIIHSPMYFLRSNIILECCFWYWYHILHRKNNSFIPKTSTINEKKLRLSSKKTVKRSIVNYKNSVWPYKGNTARISKQSLYPTIRQPPDFIPWHHIRHIIEMASEKESIAVSRYCSITSRLSIKWPNSKTMQISYKQ